MKNILKISGIFFGGVIVGAILMNLLDMASTGRPLCGEGFFDTLEAIVNRELKPKKGGRPSNRKP